MLCPGLVALRKWPQTAFEEMGLLTSSNPTFWSLGWLLAVRVLSSRIGQHSAVRTATRILANHNGHLCHIWQYDQLVIQIPLSRSEMECDAVHHRALVFPECCARQAWLPFCAHR